MIPSTATILEAAKVLSDNNILSAPVRDMTKPADAPWTDKYLGLVDATDIVLFLVNAMEGKYDGRPSFMESLTNTGAVVRATHRFTHIVAARRLTALPSFPRTQTSRPVTDVLHVFKFGPFVPLDESATLLDAILILGKHGLHRLCVVQLGGDIVNVITQSAMLKALNDAMPHMAAVAAKTLAELGLAEPREVVASRLDDCVWTALHAMRTHNVSAVPITGADGAIVGVFSNRDIRLLMTSKDLYPRMFQTLREFTAAKLAAEVDAKMPVFSVRAEETMGRTVAQLYALRVHRLFVTDARNRVTGVVSLSDVLSVLVHEPAGYFGSYFDV